MHIDLRSLPIAIMHFIMIQTFPVVDVDWLCFDDFGII